MPMHLSKTFPLPKELEHPLEVVICLARKENWAGPQCFHFQWWNKRLAKADLVGHCYW